MGASEDLISSVRLYLTEGSPAMTIVSEARAKNIAPADVHSVLAKHILADGYDIVMDLRRSQGSWVYDAKNDRKLLDFFSNFASCPIGYNHPKLDTPEMREKLIYAALNKPANSDIYTPEMAEFVEAFSRIAMPAGFQKHMFFVEGGALANENAMKAAFDWKVRKNFERGVKEERGSQVMHLAEAFHGRSGYTLTVTNTADPRKTQYFPKFDWPRIPNPKMRFPADEANTADVTRREQEALNAAKKFISERGDDIAAFIMEPIQGEGGDNHFRPEFLRAIRQLCDENEIMLIFDEVQSGVGLTGKMWAHQHYGIEPDMFTFGKKTQVCGFASTGRIDEIRDNVFNVSSRINSTWGGNLVDMVRSQRYFEIIEEDSLVANAATVGKQLMDGLHALASSMPQAVSNVRGLGLMIAFDLPDGDTRDKALNAMEANELLALSSGRNSIRFRPALNLTPDEAQEGLRRIEKSLRQVGG